MLGSIKATAKDSVIYGFGNIAVKIVGLILIPLYTDKKYFSVEEFGIIGLLDISGLMLTAILTFSLPQAFTRWFWDKAYRGNQKGIFFMTLVSQIVVATALCILLIPLSGTFSKILFQSTDWSKVITLLILSSAIQVVNNLISTHMRLQSKSTLYTLTNILKLVVVLSLTLYFILVAKMGIEGIYLAQVIGNIFFVFITLIYTVRNCSIYFDLHTLKGMNIYGFPLFLGGVAAVLLNVIDRYSLNTWSVLKSVALYTLAIKISSVIKLVFVDSIKLAILPTFLKKMDSSDNGRFYSKTLTYTSFIIMFAIVGLSMFSLEIVKVISTSKDFWDAIVIIPILSLSVFFVNLKEVTVYGLHIAKKSRIVGMIVVGATILSLILNILLIPRWDITGAAIATLLSQMFYWIACYRFAQKAFFVPYELKKIFILLFIGTLFSFSSLFLNDLDLALRLVIKSFLVIIFPFILYVFNFYDRVEIEAIKGFAAKWSNLRMLKKNLISLKDIKDED
jgi:O-antigen/teichoic acid export membrane protein